MLETGPAWEPYKTWIDLPVGGFCVLLVGLLPFTKQRPLMTWLSGVSHDHDTTDHADGWKDTDTEWAQAHMMQALWPPVESNIDSCHLTLDVHITWIWLRNTRLSHESGYVTQEFHKKLATIAKYKSFTRSWLRTRIYYSLVFDIIKLK